MVMRNRIITILRSVELDFISIQITLRLSLPEFVPESQVNGSCHMKDSMTRFLD